VASFVSASGGVGKTKLSLTLAYHLSRSNRKVLFIDMDPTAGASLVVFSEEEYDNHVTARNTLSDALEQYLIQRAIVEPSSVIVRAKVGDAFVDFVLPGEKLIRVVDELWRSSSAGLRFKKALESFIPFARYDYILVDNAPFFDPRYTALSLHISDCIFIPLRPSLIDLKRTLRMVFWLEDEMETIENGEKLRENLYAVFNHVPTNREQVERRFVENFLEGKEGERFSTPDRTRQYETLLIHAKQLKSKGVKFMNSYVEVSSDIERFPAPTTRVHSKKEEHALPQKAKEFITEASQVLEGLLRKPFII
jgi:cellulose biosynthesis protein BcsQ